MSSRRRGGITALVGLVLVLLTVAFLGLDRPAPAGTPRPSGPASPSEPIRTPAGTATPSQSGQSSEMPVPPGEDTPEPCGSFDPRCSQLPVDGASARITPELDCGEAGGCVLTVGISHPRGKTGLPVVVVVPGGPRPPGADPLMSDFGLLLASQGAVVMTAEYRSTRQWGGGYPASYRDVACAIRFARAHASEWGGDGSRVILVGHSFGAFIASTVALSTDPFTPDAASCLTTEGSTKPDAFVGIAGVYSQGDISTETLDAFFSGTRAQAPGAWAAGDPVALVKSKSRLGIPVRLVQGAIDTNVTPASAESFEAALETSGYDSSLTLVAGADHTGILQKPVTIRVVMQTALGLK